jgi:hypothetical protein
MHAWMRGLEPVTFSGAADDVLVLLLVTPVPLLLLLSAVEDGPLLRTVKEGSSRTTASPAAADSLPAANPADFCFELGPWSAMMTTASLLASSCCGLSGVSPTGAAPAAASCMALMRAALSRSLRCFLLSWPKPCCCAA